MAARKCIRFLGDLFCNYKHVKLLATREYIYSKNNINKVQHSHLSYLMPLKPTKLSKDTSGAMFGRHQRSSYSGNTSRQGCPICSQNLTFTYKDVLLLSQFLSPQGNILNRRITGVCRKQQRKIEKAIEISTRLGLIPKYQQQQDIKL